MKTKSKSSGLKFRYHNTWAFILWHNWLLTIGSNPYHTWVCKNFKHSIIMPKDNNNFLLLISSHNFICTKTTIIIFTCHFLELIASIDMVFYDWYTCFVIILMTSIQVLGQTIICHFSRLVACNLYPSRNFILSYKIPFEKNPPILNCSLQFVVICVTYIIFRIKLHS